MTFTRILQFPINTSFIKIHHKIYEFFRPFLITFIERFKKDEEGKNSPINLNFDKDETNEDVILKEFQYFLTL